MLERQAFNRFSCLHQVLKKITRKLPDYSAFGRKATLRINPDKIPDLHWKLANTYHTTKIGQINPQVTCVSTHCIDVDTLSHAKGDRCGNWCGTTLSTDTVVLHSNIEPVISTAIHNDEYKV